MRHVVALNVDLPARCAACGEPHPPGEDSPKVCEALRAASETGARPAGVPVRVQAAYVEARRALRKDAPGVAIAVLQWLLAHMAESRGASPGLPLAAKLASLRDAGVIAKTMRPELIEQARQATSSVEDAWALMTVVEHALARAYMRARA
jgi:hypothetical protein